MKKYILKPLILCVFSLLIVSCSNSDDNNSPMEIPSPFVTDINGQQFIPSATPSAEMSNSGRFIVINATNNSSSETIRLELGDFNGTGAELAIGTYEITIDSGTKLSYFVDGGSYVADDNGRIVITNLDTTARKISGTFQGTVSGSFGTNGSFTISNGIFTDITYSVQ